MSTESRGRFRKKRFRAVPPSVRSCCPRGGWRTGRSGGRRDAVPFPALRGESRSMQLEPVTVRVTGSYRFLPRTMEHVLRYDEIPAGHTGSTGMTVHIDHASRLQGMQRGQLACGNLVPAAMLFQEEPGFGYSYCIAQQLRVGDDLINVVHRNGLQGPPDFLPAASQAWALQDVDECPFRRGDLQVEALTVHRVHKEGLGVL